MYPLLMDNLPKPLKYRNVERGKEREVIHVDESEGVRRVGVCCSCKGLKEEPFLRLGK